MSVTVNTRFDKTSGHHQEVGHMSGYVETDAGAAASSTFAVGFSPRIVRFKNVGDRVCYEWFAGMTSPGALKTAASGTVTLETKEGVTVGEDSFTIPASILQPSRKFVWEAVG